MTNPELLNINVLKQSIEAIGLESFGVTEIHADATPEQLAEMLDGYFRTNFNVEQDLIACFNCQMPSTSDYTICPFCGAVFDIVVPGTKYVRLQDGVTVEVVEVNDTLAVCDVNGEKVEIDTADLGDLKSYTPIEEGSEPVDASPPPAPAPKPAAAPAPKPAAAPAPKPAAAPAAPADDKKGGKKKGPEKKAAQPDKKAPEKKAAATPPSAPPKPAPEKAGANKPPQSTSLIPVEEVASNPDPVPDDLSDLPLEKMEELMKFRRSQAAADIHDLGRIMSEIHGRELYKDAGFTSWEQYVVSRWGITRQTAYTWMAISHDYTRQQAMELGVAKAGILLKAPPEEKKKLVEEAKNPEVTTRQVRENVDKARKEKGFSDERAKKARTPHSVSLADILNVTFTQDWQEDTEGKWADIPLKANVYIRIFPTETGINGQIIELKPEPEKK